MKPVLITPPDPGKSLVSLVQAKRHCNVDWGDDDDLIAGYIAAATAWLDGYSGVLGGRALLEQTWRLNLSCWPACRIRLPLAPVSAIASIKYFDAVNQVQTLDPANYSLLEDALSPYVAWNRDAALPALFERQDAIAVDFIAGYGSEAEDVPSTIRLAIMMLVATWYANRETSAAGANIGEIPFAVTALIAPFRRVCL